MRTAFVRSLVALAERDSAVTLVVGDLGYGVVEPFAKRFPDRYLNAGVAEQNMTGIAAGLALSGRTVFTYSIGNFPTLRCLEQIRNDICYHELNVNIVAVGGGFAYGALGMTHHATEDFAIMRALPDMVVVAPGDAIEAAAATKALARWNGPGYLRLGRARETTVNPASLEFELGRANLVRDGTDVTLVSTGAMLETAVTVADQLASNGVEARVLSMHTLKPLDEGALMRAARETGAIVTLEEHSVIGGLGGAAAEFLLEACDERLRFRRIGLPSVFARVAGSQSYLRRRHGLSEDAILAKIRALLA